MKKDYEKVVKKNQINKTNKSNITPTCKKKEPKNKQKNLKRKKTNGKKNSNTI